MASIIDAYNETMNEKAIGAKVVIFTIPFYFVTNFFLKSDMASFYFWGSILLALVLALITKGINNVRINSMEILTLNPLSLLWASAKALAVVIPNVLIFGTIGKLITSIYIPVDIENFNTIFHIIVWTIIAGIIITSYLSFAKFLSIKQGFNYKAIFESCFDVLLRLVMMGVVLALLNVVIVGPVAGGFHFFNLPFTHWGFVLFCCVVAVLDVSMLTNYLAQVAYEQIKGSNEDYNENMRMDIIDDKFVEDAKNAKK